MTAVKKPEIKTLKYIDWFDLERYMVANHKKKWEKLGGHDILQELEARNDSYIGFPRVGDLDPRWDKPERIELVTLIESEFGPISCIWVCW